MKKFLLTGCRPAVCLVLIFCLGFILLNCGKFSSDEPLDLGAPQLPTNLCVGHDAGESWILAVTEKQGIPLNEIYYGFIDSAAIASIIEKDVRKIIAEYIFDIGDWYAKQGPISYTFLIVRMIDVKEQYFIKYGEKAALIEGILIRRIGKFRSDILISPYDDCLLRAGHAGVIRDLYLKRPKEE